MSAADLELIGIWLLVGAALVIVLEGVLAAVWSLRLGRKARVLSERLASEQVQLRADVARLQANLVEMQVLWQPYRRVLRLVRHPLTIALMQSYARRRAAVR